MRNPRTKRASRATRKTRRSRRIQLALAAALGASIGALAYHVVTLTPSPSHAPAPAPAPAVTQQAPPVRTYRHADFSGEDASADARAIADWVVDSGDNEGMPFVIVDKFDAKVFVFDPAGHLRGASAALLGFARGDHSVPGIGDKPLSQVTPEERTTPAGRFVAEPGVNLSGERVVWVDYDAAVSIHAVRTANARERRLQRLASATSADNRISYGCINVPGEFFRNVVASAFDGTRGIVYVLPETRPAQVVFGSYAVPPSAPQASSAVALTGPRE